MSSSSNLLLTSDLIADLLSNASQFNFNFDSFSKDDFALGQKVVDRALSDLSSDVSTSDLATLASRASNGVLVSDLATLASRASNGVLVSDLAALASTSRASNGVLVSDLAALAADLVSKGTLSSDSLTNIATNLSSAFQSTLQKDSQLAPPASNGPQTGCMCSYCQRLRAMQSAPSAFDPSIGVSGVSGFMGLPANGAAFTTVGSNGERVSNGMVNGLPFIGNQLKWNNTDSSGATLVTYAFDNSFGVNGVSTERAKTLFASALQTWADYAPLDFVETTDPGSGDKVDIFAQSAAIDGLGKTLAYTYFPTVGDVTYDTAETWTENSFLETTVHELGHALGLDHEDNAPAIMNSVLSNRYTDVNKPFLFDDDINSIRSLYGSGKGSVVTLNPLTPLTPLTPEPTIATGPNLVTNGSFEDVPVNVGESAGYSQVKGWSTIAGDGFWVDRRPETVGQAADGTAWANLDMNGKNSTIGQNIDTLTGQSYGLSVDFSNGGESDSTTSIEVFWEGIKLDTLSGGGKGSWRHFDYDVKGGNRSVSTLAFRAIGPADNVGGFIDNIVVQAAKEASIAPPDQGLGAAAMPTANRDPISGDHHDLVAADSLASQPLTPSTSPNWI